MDLAKIEIEAVAEKIDEVEIKQLAELELALVGGGNGVVCF